MQNTAYAKPEDAKLITTLSGHSNSVYSVAFSPDGKYLASGSYDKTIKLYDVSDPKNAREIKTLKGHSDYVYSVVFSPDGKYLVSGSYDDTIKLYDVIDPKNAYEIKTLSGHSGDVNSVAFSPDGKYLASASDDNTIKLYDVIDPKNAREIKTLSGHSNWVRSVAFSPDGKYLASGSYKEIKLWNVIDPKNAIEIKTLKGHSSYVWSLVFSPNGNYLASASTDKTIKLWNVTDPKNAIEIKTLSGHSDDVNSVAFSPDGKYLASGSDDNTIKLWDTGLEAIVDTIIIKQPEKKVALLIGNANYTNSPLPNPVYDAIDMGKALEELGFEVTIETNLGTKRKMEEVIKEFRNKADDSDVALFYYSGHGCQIDGENYLIPTKEDITESIDVEYNALNLSFVINIMERAANPINICILDACRDHPFSSDKSINKGLAVVDASKGTLIAYATSPNKVAKSSNRGRNSIYTKYLLEEIHTPNIIIEKTLKLVGEKVSKETNNKQRPWTNSCLYEEFIFNYKSE